MYVRLCVVLGIERFSIFLALVRRIPLRVTIVLRPS